MEERVAAAGVKRDKPILVVLGNPPYNAFAGVGTTQEERDLVAPYKNGLVKAWGIKKFNLDDLYVRFFRMAERRIAEQTGQGVVSYISSSSHLSDPSFVVMRRRFLNEFDRLWFDNMNGDSRETGKRTPDGKPDPSVFSTEYNKAGIRVGTAVSVLVRKKEREAEPTVRYRELWGVDKRAELLQSLKAIDLTAQYKEARPTGQNRYTFRPGRVSDIYQTWPRIADLCAAGPYNGPVERRGQALISTDKLALAERIQAYFDKSVSNEMIATIYPSLMMTGNRIVGPEAREKILKAHVYDPSAITRYPFKPFDVRWCYLANLRPLFSEPAPELLDQRFPGNSYLVVRETGDKDSNSPPFYFSSLICDYHSLVVEAKHIPILRRSMPFTTGHKHQRQGQLLNESDRTPVTTTNLSPSSREYLATLGIPEPKAGSKAAALVWTHALAIGYSPQYLEGNRDSLRRDWPRIPLPATRELLEASAAQGDRLAALLDTENTVPGVTTGPVRTELAVVGSITRQGGGQLQPGDRELTAGWGHRGKDGAVMPGKGKVLERDYSPEERAAIQEGAARLGLSLKDALACLGDTTYDIYLNDVAYWRNVPKGVWGYIIGGYQVMKKWLSYREQSILGRGLRPEEIREVTDMARRLAAILLLQPSLDANYQACKADTYPWPGGTVEKL
jgi:hypothetical protein